MRNVNDTGLEIMLQLLKNVESRGAQGQVLFFTFEHEANSILGILQNLLARSPIPNLRRRHRRNPHGRTPNALPNFMPHFQGKNCFITLFSLINQSLENGTIAVPLYSDPNENNADWVRANFNEIQQKNIEYVKNYIAELLQKHFKTLQM